MDDLSLDQLGLPAVQRSMLPSERLVELAATLDQPLDTVDATSPLAAPLLWHWACFTPSTRTSDLGTDGHPRRTDPFASELPRRMWVGGSVEADAPLWADREAIRRTELLDVVGKDGKQGTLLFVTLEHQIEQAGHVARRERQDIVYRAGGHTGPPGERVDVAGPADGWREVLTATPVQLFRFSAVTFNSHRIHYDADYARDVEGYPALVVHGPLTAMRLAASAERHLGGPLGSFEFRASAPLFVSDELTIVGDAGPPAEVAAYRSDSLQAMSARVGLASG
jgi:3-methylfumaryl-CoA hydratase